MQRQRQAKRTDHVATKGEKYDDYATNDKLNRSYPMKMLEKMAWIGSIALFFAHIHYHKYASPGTGIIEPITTAIVIPEKSDHILSKKNNPVISKENSHMSPQLRPPIQLADPEIAREPPIKLTESEIITRLSTITYKARDASSKVTITDEMIILGYSEGYIEVEKRKIGFIHYGPMRGMKGYGAGSEVLLLNGDGNTMYEWESSGIMNNMCKMNKQMQCMFNMGFSVTALNLNVGSVEDFEEMFDELTKFGVLSGRPVFVVTPELSSQVLFDLANQPEKLQKIVAGWIPMLFPPVLKEPNAELRTHVRYQIPVLAIYGSKSDSHLTEFTNKLVLFEDFQSLRVRGVDSGGYLLKASPAFTDAVKKFIADSYKPPIHA